MKKIYLIVLLCCSILSLKAQMFPPEGEFEPLLIKADLTPEKRLADFLTEYIVEDWWGDSFYEGPTELDISGLITREDLDVIYKIQTIQKIDAEHASFIDNTVPKYAFCMDGGMFQEGIRSLIEVVLPTNIEVIEAQSFTNCIQLNKINLNQLTSLRKIGANAFDNSNLTSIYIPEKCIDLAETTFLYCMNIESIVVDTKNAKYESESGALYDKQAKALILYPKKSRNKSLIVKAGTDSIIATCFSENEFLENVDLPNSLTKLGRNAFQGTTKLKSIVIPGSIKKLDATFFSSSIESVQLSEGLEVIGESSFYKCSNLRSMILPKTINKIGFLAFGECINLKSVNFEELVSLAFIDDRAFLNCVGLSQVDLSQSSQLSSIGRISFKNCSSIHTLKLPENLTKIANEAFINCELLDLKKYPSSLTYIGDHAFANNSSLTTIEIGELVTYLGNGAFSNCRNVSDLSVSENNTEYVLYENMIMKSDGSAVLYASPNTSLDELDLSEMQELGDYVLAGNKSIKRVILGYNLTSVGVGAFADMPQLEAIDFSHCAQLTKIGANGFKGAVSLKSVLLPKDDASKKLEIGESAFEGCENLKNITFPAQTSSLGMYVFRNCTNLTAVDISKTKVTAIADLFINCVQLSDFKINNKVFRIGENSFNNCKSLTSFEIPNSMTYGLTAAPFAGSGINTFIVEPTHVSYKAINGEVYSKDGSQLIVCPPAKTGVYKVMDGVTRIGAKSFSGNEKITKVVLPASLLKPEYQNIEGSFHEMHGLEAFETIDNHPSIKIIDGAIYCTEGKILYSYPAGKSDPKITLAASTETIVDKAFSSNKKIEEIDFPNKLTEINISFEDAIGLRKIVLPASIKSIRGSFEGAENLTEVICNAINPPGMDLFTFRNTKVNTIYVPGESVEKYKADEEWSAFTILPFDATSIEKNEATDLHITCKDGFVHIVSEIPVTEVKVYNLNGQLIKLSNSPDFNLKISKNSLIVLSVLLENGNTVNRKLIVR